MRRKKILAALLVLLSVLTVFSFSASALSWDGSSAGGSTNAVNGSATGYVIRATNDSNCVVGYRFSVVNSSGGMKVNKVIDVFRNTSNGNNAYSTSAKFSVKYNKKRLIANKNAKLTTTLNTTNCIKESAMGFATALPNPSGVETWQAYEANINKVLSKLGVGTTSNMVYGDKVIIEPLFDICLAGEYQALTVSEIAYCGRSVKGGSSDGGKSSGTSSTWGFISNYTNRIWPNKLYTPDGQGLWTSASTIASSTKATFNTILTKGYGAGIAYNETANLTYTIKFNGNGSTGGSTASMSMVKDVSKNLTANGFTRTGYTFKNWNKKTDGSGTIYKNKQSVKNLTNTQGATVNLYAQWNPNTYTISFNGNGKTGGSTASMSMTYDTAKKLTANGFTKTGHSFSGWNTKSNGDGTSYKNKQSVKNLTSANGATITLYAKWTPNKYTVSYDANGGSGAPADQTKTYGVNLTLSSTKPTRTGYTFSKWNTKADGTGTNYNSGAKYTGNANLTLYAVWTPITYTVTYNANGGSGAPGNQTKTYGVALTLSSTKPTRTGYTFVKWNTKSDGTGTNYNSGAKYTGNANLTLYAQWKEERKLSLEPITPNSSYREDTEVITSFNLVNSGTKSCVPSENVSVLFKVYKDSTVIKTITKTQVAVPANDKNLLYFKWTVPKNIGSSTIYISGEIIENGTSYGLVKRSYSTCKYTVSSTPDTQYEISAPSGFTVPGVPTEKNDIATWNEWSYADGVFKKTSYGIGFSSDKPKITPAASANAAFNNGVWTMKSGYGVEMALLNGIKSVSGYAVPNADSYTLSQYAIAKFPEFSYLTSINKYRTLELASNQWIFRQNSSYGRLHFTPLWYPDGNYTATVEQSDLWTPAGMITRKVNTNTVIIKGSAYNDWYIS